MMDAQRPQILVLVTPEETRFIETFIRRLRRTLLKLMRKQGGTEAHILREVFLNWDRDASGGIDAEELLGAMASLGLLITPSEAHRLVAHFATGRKREEFKYQNLVAEVCRGIATPMDHPVVPPDDGSSTSEVSRVPSDAVQMFTTKLVRCLKRRMVRGGTEESILYEVRL